MYLRRWSTADPCQRLAAIVVPFGGGVGLRNVRLQHIVLRGVPGCSSVDAPVIDNCELGETITVMRTSPVVDRYI